MVRVDDVWLLTLTFCGLLVAKRNFYKQIVNHELLSLFIIPLLAGWHIPYMDLTLWYCKAGTGSSVDGFAI